MAADGVGEYVVGVPIFNSETQGQTLDSLQVDSTYPYISSITMIAPSPDWFTGFYDFPASSGGTWYSEFTIETTPWDAGTETGTTFSGSNPAEDPVQPIFALTVSTVPDSGVFLDQDGTMVLPVASWACTLVTSDSAPTEAPSGAFEKSLLPFAVVTLFTVVTGLVW